MELFGGVEDRQFCGELLCGDSELGWGRHPDCSTSEIWWAGSRTVNLEAVLLDGLW
jgi:hypothetical protein